MRKIKQQAAATTPAPTPLFDVPSPPHTPRVQPPLSTCGLHLAPEELPYAVYIHPDAPGEVGFWTICLPGVSDTRANQDSALWLTAIDKTRVKDHELYLALRQLRAWGCLFGWTPTGMLKLNWRGCLKNVPAMECSTGHMMEVLARNQKTMIGVPESQHARLVTLLERYLEPFREKMLSLFREIVAGWPEEARW